jgi:hypothetical protein
MFLTNLSTEFEEFDRIYFSESNESVSVCIF